MLKHFDYYEVLDCTIYQVRRYDGCVGGDRAHRNLCASDLPEFGKAAAANLPSFRDLDSQS